MPVSNTRPRLWITSATLPQLKARAVLTNDRWTPVLAAANVNPADWNSGIVNYALAYLMTGNNDYAARAWALMAQSMASGVNQVTPDSGYQARNFFPASAVCYDWLYGWMNDAQKAQLRASIEVCSDWTWPETNPARKGQWGVDDPGNNYYHGFLFTWMAGLALMGDSPKAQGYLDNARRRWDTEVVPYLNTQAAGGLFAEGMGYGTASTGFILWNLLAHKSATGENLIQGQWIGDLLEALDFFTIPSRREMAPFGDLGAGPINDYHRRMGLCMGWKHWLDSVIPNRNQQRLTQWEEFLWYPSPDTIDPAANFYFAPGIGAVSSRTGWTAKDTQLLAVCGPTTQSHQDRAQGTFYLFSGDWLAASAKMFSHTGLRQDCWDHNTISVDSQRQTQTQDGCRYLQQEDTPLYTYLQMDLAAAYQGQLTSFTRELFWLKPNLLLVRDVFNPVNPAAQVAFNLNVLNQPEADLLGGFAVVGDSGAKLFGIAQDWKFTSGQVPLEPNQWHPSYRLQLLGAGAQSYTVGLEVALPQQVARTVTPFAATNLRGMVCGNNLVAAVVLPPPFSYTSPVKGQHFLYSLKPGVEYQVGTFGSVAASAAGVITFTPPVGLTGPITISEGGTPPPPPPPPPPHGRTWQLYLPPDGGALQVTEIPPAARPEE